MRVEGDAYLFSPETVEAGMPVRLVFDPAGLPGCSRDLAIPDYEIAKVISAEDATIEFTPAAPGLEVLPECALETGYSESRDGKVRDEFLNGEIF